jgi:hypothetical protein
MNDFDEQNVDKKCNQTFGDCLHGFFYFLNRFSFSQSIANLPVSRQISCACQDQVSNTTQTHHRMMITALLYNQPMKDKSSQAAVFYLFFPKNRKDKKVHG